MGERFLVGYPIDGRWHRPPLEVVVGLRRSDPENDLSRKRSAEFGFKIYPDDRRSPPLRRRKLAVDAVLIIGEHGKYPDNEFGQTKYPRYEFFKQVTDVFRKDGRVVPVFNDKHLSWKWEWAKEMVDTRAKLKVPFLAGSSLPVTWRMPSIEMPYGAEVEEMLVHRLGRRGQLRLPRAGDDPVHGRAASRRRDRRGRPSRGCAATRCGRRWTPAVGRRAAGTRGCSRRASAAPRRWRSRRRSATATRPPEQIREWVKDPVAYRIEYADGLRATMLLMNGLVERFHVRRAAEGSGRAALDAVLPAAESERGLFGHADVEGRGAVPDRQGRPIRSSGRC